MRQESDVEEEEEEEEEPEVEEVVTDRARLEKGWRPAAPELCRADERRVLDIEKRVEEAASFRVATGRRRRLCAGSGRAGSFEGQRGLRFTSSGLARAT